MTKRPKFKSRRFDLDTTRLDYIHEQITVETEDVKRLESDLVALQLNRLEKLQHLGLVAKIHRLARHDKLEHCYGTYWLCKRVEKSATGLRVDGKALRLAGMLHSIGHLPFSYATERVVIQLYHIHARTKRWLDDVFKKCADFVGDPELEEIANGLVKSNNFYRIYRWLSAYKMAGSASMNNSLGKQIVRHLVDVKCLGYNLLNELDALDYVLRDLLYLGRGRIEPSMEPLLAGFREGPDGTLVRPELLKIIDATKNSLNDQVYMDGRVRCLAQVVGKALLSEVLEGHTQIEQLLDMDDRTFESALKTFRCQPVDIDELVTRVNAGGIAEVARLKCDGGLLVDREAQLAGTNKTRLHDYPQKKGIYVECLPSWGPVEEGFLSVGIVYDFKEGRIEHLVRAFLRAEEWVPDEPESVYLSYGERVLGLVFGLRARARREHVGAAARPTISRHMSKVWREMKDLPYEEREKFSLSLWREGWEMSWWANQEVGFADGPIAWLTKHFIEFPEHFQTQRITAIADSLRRSKRHKRRQALLEYICYLRAILDMRADSRVGWVLPCVKLTDDEEGQDRFKIDCVTLSCPRGSRGIIRLELREVSTDQSTAKKLEERRKLEMVAHRVRSRFPRGIEVRGFFNQERFSGL